VALIVNRLENEAVQLNQVSRKILNIFSYGHILSGFELNLKNPIRKKKFKTKNILSSCNRLLTFDFLTIPCQKVYHVSTFLSDTFIYFTFPFIRID
jgi:hypothetical protein